MNRKQYNSRVSTREKRSPSVKNCALAFISGGAVCTLGRVLSDLFTSLGAGEELVSALVPVTLVFAAGLFTGIGVYDKAARICGAGLFVPITGFSNAVASSAIEARSEGMITGVGADIFRIAGPVIVYGNAAAVIYGIAYYIYLCIAGA